MDFEIIMQEVVKRIDTMKFNQKFELKDLFPGCKWEKFEKGDRIKLGKYFKNQVDEGKIPNIKYKGKRNNNHCEYIKSPKEKH